MWARVVVHAPGGYEQWLAEAADPFRTRSPVEVGRLLYTKNGCLTCHTLDGSRSTGPSFRGLFGHEVALRDGSRVTADENYLRESILFPQARIVAGYEPVMPTYKGQLKDREIMALVEFIKTVANAGQAAP
jgi:cytochrome c oxidase subunit 2